MAGWADDLEDLPLTYTFSWKGSQGWWAPITVGGTAPFVEAYLAQGDAPSFLVALSLHVRDQLGAETTTGLCANEATDVGVGAELAACFVKVEPYAAGTPVASGISLVEFYASTDFDVRRARTRRARHRWMHVWTATPRLTLTSYPPYRCRLYLFLH